MANAVIRQLPNALTTLRLLLAVPICLAILDERYESVLWLVLAAGISDGLDGWLARRLDATSRYGAIVDPLSDKALLSGAFFCFAFVGLLPWWLALVVVGRDVLIVVGALAYHALYGRYEMAPSNWGKGSTFVQILFAVLVIVQQVVPILPELVIYGLEGALVVTALVSGGHYVYIWGQKAAQARRADAATANSDR